MKKKLICSAAAISLAAFSLTGCTKNINPGDIAGFDEGEEYLSIWVHSIEETPEGEAYRQAVYSFNETYNGKYLRMLSLFPEMTAAEVIPIR